MSTYSFQDVQATFSGPTGVFDMGYGSGVAKEGISIEAPEDKNTRTIGADGSGMNSLHAGNPKDVTVRLLKTSNTNQLLQTAYNAQKLSGATWGQNSITVRNSAAADLHQLSGVAFARQARVTYAEVGDIMEWTFHAIEGDTILGNYTP